MTAETSRYPGPQADRDNAEFLTAWWEGRLMLQSCADCGRGFFYPRPLCPHCWSASLTWIAAAGRGEVVAFSLIYRPNHPAFFAETPIALDEIRIMEGVTLLARIIGANPSELRSGMAVHLVPMPDAAHFPLPTFQLD